MRPRKRWASGPRSLGPVAAVCMVGEGKGNPFCLLGPAALLNLAVASWPSWVEFACGMVGGRGAPSLLLSPSLMAGPGAGP